MNIKIEVQMTVKIMYNYVLHHTYTSIGGIFGMVLGIVCLCWSGQKLIIGEMSQTILALLFIGFMFVFVNPMMLWNKSRKQVKNTPSFQQPIYYELNEEGIIIRQEEQEAQMPWDSVMKITATNMSVIVYFSRMRAFIFPKEALGDNYTNAVKLMFTHVPSNKVKIRTVS